MNGRREFEPEVTANAEWSYRPTNPDGPTIPFF